MHTRFFLLAIVAVCLQLWSCKTVRVASVSPAAYSPYPLVQIDTVAFQAMLDSLAYADSIATAQALANIFPEPTTPDTISMVGVGDIMLGTDFPEASYLPPRSTRLLSEVAPILRNAHVTFGNLEGTLLDGPGEPKQCQNPDVCYLFRSPTHMAEQLKEAGFDVLSLANNHSGDFGSAGRKSTLRTLDSLDIHYAGFEDVPYTIFEKEGITYGMAAFAPNRGTVSINDHDYAARLIRHLDSLCHIVIVSFHGGAEGKDHEHVPRKNEIFYGENRGNVYAFARAVIDAGADVVFGHGPHVTRAIDLYKNRFIAYSLGNFATYARFNLSGPNGLAPIVKVYMKKDGTFLYGQIFPIIQKGAGGPVIDPSKQVIFKIQELTHIDFPEAKLQVDDSGLINYLQHDF
jgi:poly-gamma-glutamate capsule biosynthesis protein CapA/YwtB (metallophosphatase superfamily)